jgi:4-hydroxy-2-oxoheptanedioate aldolase
MLVGALLEDARVIDTLDDILAVPGIDYFGIGHNDFSQSLGYPGQPDHPEVVKAMADITARIHRAGRKMGEDIMTSAWVSDMLLEAGQHLLKGRKR